MEDNLNTVTVGIDHNVFVKLKRLLLVASEEIDLDTLDANLL